MLESGQVSVAAPRRLTRLRDAVVVRGRALRVRAAHERDFRSFRRRTRTSCGRRRRLPGGVALLASLSYSTYQAKLEGIFAKALQLKGLEPVVVTLPDAELTRRYHELFGITAS